MEVIFVNRPLSGKEAAYIKAKLSSSGNPIKLYSNFNLPPNLAAYSIGNYELTAKEKKSINYEIFDRILKFGEIITGDKALTDLLTIENTSIWHFHKFRSYFFIRNLVFEIKLIQKLSENFNKIDYYCEPELLKIYPFNLPGLTIYPLQKETLKTNYKALFQYSVFFLLRTCFGLFQLSRFRKVKHVVIDHAIRQTCLNIKTLKAQQGNYYIEYLFEKLDDEFIILEDADIPKFHLGSGFELKKYHFNHKGKLYGEWILFSGLISHKTRKQLKNLKSLLNKRYFIAESCLSDPLDLITMKYLRSLHSTSKFFLFKYLAYKSFFSKHPLTSISTIDENSPRIKSILDAARANKIKTIGIQHGTIHDLHPAYVYTLEDAQRKLVPDYTLVWGENWKRLLAEKGRYNPESLIITGQIRTDIVPVLMREKIQPPIILPENSKIILFASQPQQDPELRKKSALDVFSAVKDITDAHLVVKLHPAESKDSGYYKELASQVGCTNYQIVLNVDLYLSISLSDIVITCFSTVGAETAYFNKPLIILDHLKQDIQKYHKEGIAFQATNAEELKVFIEKILNSQLSINATAYDNFIRNYAYRIDGNTGERIINFIKNI